MGTCAGAHRLTVCYLAWGCVVPDAAALSQVISSTTAYILEQSTVDPVTKTMWTTTRNLTHTRAMAVMESQTIRPHPENPAWTQVTTEARIVSNVGWGLKNRVEQFGLARFQSSCEKVRGRSVRAGPARRQAPHRNRWPPSHALPHRPPQSRQALRFTLNALKQLAV